MLRARAIMRLERTDITVKHIAHRKPWNRHHDAAGEPSIGAAGHFGRASRDMHGGRTCRFHATAVSLDVGARRLGVHLVERFHWQRNGRRARIWTEHLGEDARERRRGRLRGRLVERGQRERIPEQFAKPGGLAVANQPVLDRLARRRRDGASRSGDFLPGQRQRDRIRRIATRSLQSSAFQSRTPGEQIDRRRQRRTGQPRSAGPCDRSS